MWAEWALTVKTTQSGNSTSFQISLQKFLFAKVPTYPFSQEEI